MGNLERARRVLAGLTIALSLGMAGAAYAAAAQPLQGKIDRSFGKGGKVAARLASTLRDSTVSSMVRQPDGGVVLAGSMETYDEEGSFERSGYVERRTPSGALDSGFGDGGIVPIEDAGLLASQPDGGVLLAISGGEVPIGSSSRLHKLGPDGRPDSSFGSLGEAPASVLVRAIAVDPKGRIVVAGLSHFDVLDRRFGLTVERLLPDGKPDESFGTKGIVELANEDRVSGLALRDDGTILVLGQGRLFALTATGALDTNFGGGIRALPDRYPRALVALPGGDVVVASSSKGYCCRPSHIILDRYRPDGSPDFGFGSDGSTSFSVQDIGYPTALAAAPGGGVVLAGNIATRSSCGRGFSCDITPIVARVTASGALDPGFGSAGRVELSLPGGTPIFASEYEPRIEGLAVTPSGEILAAGDSGEASDAVVVALQPSGAPNLSFGDSGVVDEMRPFPSDSYSPELAIGPGARLALSVTSDAGSHVDRSVLLSAGPNGNFEEVPDSGPRFVAPEAERWLYSDGRGHFYFFRPGRKRRVVPRVSRFDAHGNRDQSYGVQGTARLPAHFFLSSVVGRRDGAVLVLGKIAGRSRIAVFALDPRGRPDRHFGRHGLVVLDFGRPAEALLATLDDRARLVILSKDGSEEGVALIRLLPDGRLDPGFGRRGRLIHLPLSSEAWSGIDASAAGIVVAAGRGPGTSGVLPATLLRLRSDGRRARAFGARGVRHLEVRGRVIPFVSGRRLVLVSGSYREGQGGIALRAFRPDGRLDRGFGRGGAMVVGSSRSYLGAAVRQPNGRVVIAATKYVSGETGSLIELLRVR